MARHFLLVLMLLGLGACYGVQTSSGAAYIDRHGASGALDIDADIAAVAGVEPNFVTPARIGVARVINGRLSTPPSAEMALWLEVARAHSDLGEFQLVSPVVVEMVRPGGADAANLVKQIRLGAARQHLDHVLIYEVGAQSRRGNTAFALADVTLIGGALLPTRQLKVAGVGQALLIDVRNGYPYGTAQTRLDLSALSVSFGAVERQARLQERAIFEVVEDLTGEVSAMLTELRRQLP